MTTTITKTHAHPPRVATFYSRLSTAITVTDKNILT